MGIQTNWTRYKANQTNLNKFMNHIGLNKQEKQTELCFCIKSEKVTAQNSRINCNKLVKRLCSKQVQKRQVANLDYLILRSSQHPVTILVPLNTKYSIFMTMAADKTH